MGQGGGGLGGGGSLLLPDCTQSVGEAKLLDNDPISAWKPVLSEEVWPFWVCCGWVPLVQDTCTLLELQTGHGNCAAHPMPAVGCGTPHSLVVPLAMHTCVGWPEVRSKTVLHWLLHVVVCPLSLPFGSISNSSNITC